MAFGVARARQDFPALAEGLAHFDGPGGTQVPAAVSDAVAGTMRAAISNRHGPFTSSRRADAVVDAAREAVADLVGGDAAGVVLGQSMTSNTYVLAGALAKTWAPGDEVVLSRLDHDADVRPWVQAAERAGVVARWADVDPQWAELPTAQYAALVTERTRLVALTAASNATGTRPDVRGVAEIAHAAGALVHVDGVHATPHLATDVRDLGADLYATSAYTWYGPHLGATVGTPAVLEQLRRTSSCPATTAARSASSTAPPTSRCWPGSPPRWTGSPRTDRASRAVSACCRRWRGSRRTSGRCSPACSTAWPRGRT